MYSNVHACALVWGPDLFLRGGRGKRERRSGDSCSTSVSLDPRPHFLEEWAWYRLLAHALIFRRYLADPDNNVYGQ